MVFKNNTELWRNKNRLLKSDLASGKLPTRKPASFLSLRRLIACGKVLIDFSPAWEAAKITIIYEEVRMELSAYI